MHTSQDKIRINKFVNHYCEGIYCGLGDFLNVSEEYYDDILSLLSLQEKETVIEYAIAKNVQAGVGSLNIKVPEFGMGLKLLDKYHLKGREIVTAKKYAQMPTSSLVGGRTMLDIESLVDYNQDLLSAISDFSARANVPLVIELASDLENVGKIVNTYSSSPAEVLESFGLLDRECFVYGLNYLDKDDQKIVKDYDKTCIFSPQSDGKRGMGAINLFNFIYHRLKFGFSSGKCYNVDMLFEGKLAVLNTFNLMHESGNISTEEVLDSLTDKSGDEIELDLFQEENIDNILDKKVHIKVEEFDSIQKKTIEIARKIKEKI